VTISSGQDVPTTLDEQIAELEAKIEPLRDELAQLKKARTTLKGDASSPRAKGTADKSILSAPRLG
jgi:hypothetical protein